MTTPWLVSLGSTNPVKRRAAESALQQLLGASAARVSCVEVDSGVPGQPWGDEQTRLGASNRALAALEACGAAAGTLGLGLEGGVASEAGRLWAFSWAVVVGTGGERGEARSAAFALPASVAAWLTRGLELGDAMDRTFGVEGSKRDLGAVGLLTGGALDRAALYAQPVLLALAALLRPLPGAR